MKNLFNDVNVSKSESQAVGAYFEITHEEWNAASSLDVIYDSLDGIGVNLSTHEYYHEGVDFIQNALDKTYEGESVFVWID